MSSSKRNDLIAAAEIVGGIIFTGIAIALSDAGFHVCGFIFGFLAVACGLTVAAHHLKKYGLKYIKTGFVVSLIFMAVLFVFLSLHKPAAEMKPVEPVKIEIAQPAYIEGTDVTYKQLEERLPFGYVIFYYSENKRFTYQVFKNGLVDWQIDWDNVKLEPDFVAGTLKWTIPAPISIVGTNINIQMKGSSAAVGVIPFKRDKIFSAGLLYDSPNKPTLWIGTLSDDQRSPVFVIGFRIESEREGGSKKQ